MSTPTPPEPGKPAAQTTQTTVAVISAYGAFRVLLVLLAIWSFFEGFALFTGGLSALSLGGHDRMAEQIVGTQMIVFVPVYALLAWKRERYRLLIWVPYGAQLAIILPTSWGLLFHSDPDGVLLLVVSLVFFVMLFYFWWSSHPLEFFSDTDDEEDVDDDDEETADEAGSDHDATSRQAPPRARDVARKPGRFRRRDS